MYLGHKNNVSAVPVHIAYDIYRTSIDDVRLRHVRLRDKGPGDFKRSACNHLTSSTVTGPLLSVIC